jgi:glutathione S-transferase
MTGITVTAFRWVPDFARGLVRDLRVRWALEEAGIPYRQRLIGLDDQASEAYRRRQPFGQVPVYEEGMLTLFESGAIVLHIAERCEALLPADAAACARVRAWMFAALNTLEPPIQNLAEIDLFHAGEAWAAERRPQVEEAVKLRLSQLACWLHDREYLEGHFTAADLLMTSVLNILRHTDLVARVPALDAYRRNCEARPAYRKALADQLASFADQPG